jgi:threonine dehydratase
MSVTLEDVRAAALEIEGEVLRTPTVRSGPLSAQLSADIHLKLETLQRTGSFKDRGALVKLKSLAAAERSRGVIAVSAGNHAQGVASHAQRLGIPATILMPEGTPFTKIRRTEAFGAEVVLQGDTLNAAEPFAHAKAEAEGLTFVHPYDDERIIAGQGTVGLEMLEDAPELDVIVVPIGGGGIISGIATAVKALRPQVEVIGVESEAYPSMYNALHGIDSVPGGDTIADGIAVKSAGRITRPIVERLVDDVVVVAEASIEAAVHALLTVANVVVEGAGAVPLAAVTQDRARFEGRRVGLVACGSNIDPRILASVLMRGMSREGHLAILRISITDQAGTLGRVAQVIGSAGGNIVETHHQRMFAHVPVKRAELDVVVETRDVAHAVRIVERLEEAGFPTRRLVEGA